MTNNTNKDNAVEERTEVTAEDALGWCRNYGQPAAEGLQAEFNRRFEVAVGWLRRRVGADAEGAVSWLWLYVAEHPQMFANKFNKAGWPGVMNKMKQLLVERWPDLRHHQHEVPWGLIGSDNWIEEE